MTDLNIRIAKIRGWTVRKNGKRFELITPDRQVYHCLSWMSEEKAWASVPKVSGSLDLMHEFEGELTPYEREEYLRHLATFWIGEMDYDDVWACTHATAAQKAEAYCRYKEGQG